MTHDRFKVLCGLAALAGLPEKWGMSPAEIVKACVDERKPESVKRQEASLPDNDPRQLTLFDTPQDYSNPPTLRMMQG